VTPDAPPRAPRSAAQIAIATWGVGSVALLLVEAIWRLTDTAVTILRREVLTPAEWAAFAAWLVFIVYVEGYRAFQLRFSPRVVARALYLADHPRPLHVALAPLYCMAMIHAPRRRLIASWVLVAGIVGIILFVRTLPPIYRAIVDAGVVCALTWGTGVMVVLFARGLRGAPMPVPPDVPPDVTDEGAGPAPGAHADVLEAAGARARDGRHEAQGDNHRQAGSGHL